MAQISEIRMTKYEIRIICVITDRRALVGSGVISRTNTQMLTAQEMSRFARHDCVTPVEATEKKQSLRMKFCYRKID